MMINAIQIALSGLTAATQRASASASNLANARTNGAIDLAKGPAPYDPVITVQTSLSDGQGGSAGVQTQVVPSGKPFVPAYSPDSPFADSSGLVASPDVNVAEEIVNLQMAETSYKANIKTIQTASDMEDALLRMIGHKA